jgi:predicted acetyltransferase
MTVIAVPPSVEYQTGFMAMLDDFDANDPSNSGFYAPARVDFQAYVQKLLDEERGVNLGLGIVPCTHRWLIEDSDVVVGVTRLRHTVDTPFLAEHGGHIGYDVAPSKRRKGYGHYALKTSLDEARRIGLSRCLLYASADNLPSRATIERAGAELERIAYSEIWNEQLCKYWVPVPAASLV